MGLSLRLPWGLCTLAMDTLSRQTQAQAASRHRSHRATCPEKGESCGHGHEWL